jgi:hypothetical protein
MMFTLLAPRFPVWPMRRRRNQTVAGKAGRAEHRYSACAGCGMKTVLTNSGVLYVTEDGKHIIQGPMYDVSGAQPVNVTC